MNLAKWALISLVSLSLSVGFAERRPGHGNNGPKPSAHSPKPKPGSHNPKPSMHNPKPKPHSPKPSAHNPKPKPVYHGNVNHYGHAYSGAYSNSYPYYYNGYYYGSPWWHNQPIGGVYVGGGTTVDVTCAPETMTKNTFAAEAVLVGLAANDLADQEVFTQKVSDFVVMSGAQKIDAGLSIAGVKNPKDAKEVLALIYAREPSNESIERVSENLNLDFDQAKLVVTAVSQALKQR